MQKLAHRKKSAKPAGKRVNKMQEAFPQADISKLSEISIKKRQQIIDAAIECFLELGYKGTSMNAVAEHARVTKQTIYSHFKDKENLFKSVIQSVTLDYVRSEINSPKMANKSSRAMLLKIARTIIARHEDPRYKRFFRTMVGEAGRFPELAQVFIEATVKPTISLVTSLLSNKDEFDIPDPNAFARVFMGTLINYCMQQNILRARQFFPFDQKRIIAEIMRLVDLHLRKS